jgi:hypothetical protein
MAASGRVATTSCEGLDGGGHLDLSGVMFKFPSTLFLLLLEVR